GGKSLHPSARAVSAGGRDLSALVSALGIVGILSCTGRTPDRTSVGGTAFAPSSEDARLGSPGGGPLCARVHLVLSGRVCLFPRARRAEYCPLYPSTAPWSGFPLWWD